MRGREPFRGVHMGFLVEALDGVAFASRRTILFAHSRTYPVRTLYPGEPFLCVRHDLDVATEHRSQSLSETGVTSMHPIRSHVISASYVQLLSRVESSEELRLLRTESGPASN